MRRFLWLFGMVLGGISILSAQWISPYPQLDRSSEFKSKVQMSGPSTIAIETAGRHTAHLTTNIDSLILAFMQTNRIPGLAACIVKHERIAWQGYYGLANIPLQDTVGPNTIFMLASVSKTITGTALMQLWQRGRFQLDDSINAYLPFPVRNPYFTWSPITFRQLLCHVSSINDTWSQMPYFMGDPPIALGLYLREYLTPGGSYYSSTNYNSSRPPGTEYSYCNIGVALCGYLVETITGIPFDQYCRDSIFVTLGMNNTAWFLRDLDTTLIARPYTWNGTYQDHGLYGYPDYPDGQLRTTMPALAKFLAANIGFGQSNGVRILDSTTVRLMRTIQYPSLSTTQGLIWFTYLLGQRLIWGHTGRDLGVRTSMFLDEASRTGAIILANFSNSSGPPFIPIAEALFNMADTITVDVREVIAGKRTPEHFHLDQNYPNPFNPSTTIKFALSGSGFVTLKVYDLLGREVGTLVNEHLQAGSYETTFDATGLASGVYFYRLRAGEFMQTKRLLVLR